jgi:hypothetical protein
MSEQNRAFVLNGDGQPLGTTKAKKAWYFVRKGKARLVGRFPLTIQLTYVIENPVLQEHTLGIDDGASRVGIAVVQHCKTEDRVVFKGEIKLRRDVKKLVSQRRSRRRARRSRGPHRKPRSRRKIGGLCPSARVRKENVLRVVKDLVKRCPISQIVIEEVSFKTNDPRFAFWGTQTQLGKNWLRERLDRIAPVTFVAGWETARFRCSFSIPKSHANDALAIALRTLPWFDEAIQFGIIARRRRQDMHNYKHDGFSGFKHWDIVEYVKRTGERFLGTVRSFVPSRRVVKCRFAFSENYCVSVGRLRLVERPGALVYLPQI